MMSTESKTETTLPADIEAWIHELKPRTAEEYAESALASATVKKTKRKFLIPHIAGAIRQAIEDDRHARR